MKALVGAFNQEKALEGAFSVIVKTDGALHSREKWRRGEERRGGGGTVFAGIQKLCNGITEQETIPVSHSRILLPWIV